LAPGLEKRKKGSKLKVELKAGAWAGEEETEKESWLSACAPRDVLRFHNETDGPKRRENPIKWF
jgi:hypothetical protein